MNKDIKRYFKECQYLFAYCGKKERKYLCSAGRLIGVSRHVFGWAVSLVR